MNRNGCVVLSIFFIITFFSCSNKPKNLIPEDEMVALMTDLNLARAIYNNSNSFRADSMSKSLIQSVLDKHGISQADLDSSLVWYADEMKIYLKISDSVTSILRKKHELANAELTRTTAEMLESDFLTHKTVRLDKYGFNYAFNIDSTNFSLCKKEYFVWSFSVKGVDSFENIEAGIYFKYKDSLVNYTTQLANNKQYKFEKPNLPDSLLQSISGYIHRGADAHNQYYPPVFISKLSFADSLAVQPSDSLIETHIDSAFTKETRGSDTTHRARSIIDRKRTTNRTRVTQ